jgi:hypothetical protein
MQELRSWGRFALLLGVFAVGCSSAPKKTDLVSLKSLHGKKVALVSIEGEDTARKITEVALINQLVKRGTFELISKGAVETARTDVDQDPTDWKGLAKRSGAELALRVRVNRFNADVKSGYSKEEVYDSQLAEENGTDGKTERIYRAKALVGDVQFELKFTDLATQTTTRGIAEATDRVESNAKLSAVTLPPRLRFLETLSNTAFKKFFEQEE